MAEISIVKISALPVAEQIDDEDLLALAQDGATKALAYGTIKEDISEELAPDATLSEAGKAADAKAVGDALALKADKTELTAEVSRIDAALNTKVNNTTYTAEVERIDGAIATKADAAATTEALATKANANDVTEALALKADAATVNAELATKADTATVNAALAAKQDTLTFDSIPTEGSTNPVTSGGVYSSEQPVLTIGEQVNVLYYVYWERGSLDIDNNTIIASPYRQEYRARTPVNHPVQLSKGDVVTTESDFQFNIEYVDGGAAVSVGWKKSWTAPSAIDAFIVIKPVTESGDEVPVETLSNSISITFANGAVTKIQNSLYRVLSTAARNADAVETPTHRPCWADYSFVSGSYVLKLSGTLDTNADTRILLMKAHTINGADMIRTIYTGVVSDGATFYFDITEEEAAEVTCVCVEQYTALAISYTVELFGAEQYYWKIEKLTGDINDLILGGVPEYYVDHIAEKIREVNANTRFINGISFPFITDLHFSANSKNSRFLLKDVLDNTACDFVVCGGDYGVVGADAETSRSYIADLLDYASTIGHDKWFAINGNHDFTGSERLTWGETYNAIYRPSERWTIDGKIGGYFCIDNDVQKTRIICLNSCMPRSEASSTVMDGMARIGYDQYQYLIDKINEVSAYKIIVVSHIASDSAMSGYTSDIAGLQTVLELLANKEAGSITASGRTLNVDFTATTNTLICHICGHSHKDESHVSNGVLSISTTCDAHYLDDGHGAVAGTVTEQAFDVFCIDYDAETINAVRVGRGASRLWNKVNNEWVESV